MMLSTILAVIRSIALFPIMHLYLLCISIKAMCLTIVPDILTRSSYTMAIPQIKQVKKRIPKLTGSNESLIFGNF